MTLEHKPHIRPIDPVLEDHMLRLYEKGYTVAALANYSGRSITEVKAAIERAARARNA